MPNNNPNGNGGFLVNPQNINREGLNRKHFILENELEDALNELVVVRDKDGSQRTLDITYFRAIIRALLNEGSRGNVKAIEVILDRLFGKSKENINFTGDITNRILTYENALKIIKGEVIDADTSTIPESTEGN